MSTTTRYPGGTAAARPRLDALLPAGLLIAGSLIFLGAGRLHPHVDSAMGPMGSEQFYRGFASEILRTPGWESMHLGILAGPLLWALGVAGVVRLLPSRVAALGETARAALLLAAGAWAVAFVLDGFNAPALARVVVGASDPTEMRHAISVFSANQRAMARLGMVSVVLMGAAQLALGIAVLANARRAVWRVAVGGAGVLVGLWPLIAAARGEFAPGPFTSPYWSLTALSMGMWFAALATALPFRAAPAVASSDATDWPGTPTPASA